MARERSSFRESPSWLSASEVFTDTQRVDLFDDPRWELTAPPAPRRAVPGEPRRASRGTSGVASVLRRTFMKRGRHSRNPV